MCRFFKRFTLITILILGLINGVYAQAEPDSTQQFKTSLDAYPYVYYTPETQLAFGAGGVVTFFPQKQRLLNPSSVTLSAFYSTIKTYQIDLDSKLFFSHNEIASSIELRFAHNIDRFYGIGNNTPDLGTEEFVLDNVGGMVDFQMPPAIIISDRAGFIIEYREYIMDDRKQNPYLQSDSVTGVKGGAVSGLGMIYVWDNRDQIFFPNDGGLTEFKFIIYTKDLGSDYTFTWLEMNSRRYWSFLADHVIAVQVYLNSVGGNPPFYKLPALGGSRIMRGYYQGRYRDFNFFSSQVEYRQYFTSRFGFITFFGIGLIDTDLTSMQIKSMKYSYGAGLRFLFNKEQKINLRMDIGFGKETSGVYFGIEEAF